LANFKGEKSTAGGPTFTDLPSTTEEREKRELPCPKRKRFAVETMEKKMGGKNHLGKREKEFRSGKEPPRT